MQDKPYFMNNKEWYEFDFEKRRFVLTEKAPEKAKKSIEDFYESLKKEHGDY